MDYDQKQAEVVRLAKECAELQEKLKRLLDALRPLIEGLYRIPKASFYFLRVDNETVQKLGEMYREVNADE